VAAGSRASTSRSRAIDEGSGRRNDPIPIVPNKVYALGDCAQLDGTLSWAPKLFRRFQRINCFLLIEGGEALLIDTGVPAHASTILFQLQRLLPPNSVLKVFVTRAELDAVANLSAIREAYDVRYVMDGGSANPFDGYNDVTAGQGSAGCALTVARTSGIDLGPARQIRIVVPLFRFLPTYWPFDVATRTLFTSDAFGWTDQSRPDGVSTLSESADPLMRESVGAHILQKFWWLPGSRTKDIKDDLVTIFDTLDPEFIAPGHGCILMGRDVIKRHVSLLLELLDAYSL
jgi:flavorubredoxin